MHDTSLTRQFVSLASPTAARNGAGFNPCQGVYLSPANKKVKTAFVATHYNVDFSEHYLGPLLAAQGYGFLGWNTRFRGNEAYFLLEHALIDIGVGVAWLRDQPGIEQVVLIGNSGGGSLMASYQSQACDPVITATWDLPLPDAVTNLPAADAYISLNAHGGRPEVLTAWMDPAITDETDLFSVDETLNMYNPHNGPPYSGEFVAMYRAAQKARNDRITARVVDELKSLSDHGRRDRPFLLFRTWADLRLMDPQLDPSDRPVGQCYAGDPHKANYSPFGIGLTNTLRTWLSMWSLEYAQCRAELHLPRIKVPALVLQSLADTGVFPSDARAIFEQIGSTQKDLQFFAGDHYLTAPESARDEVTERICSWVDKYVS